MRGTLRDTISYLAVQQLAASNLWSARQSNELYRVGVDRLIGSVADVPLDGDEHPLVKAVAVLDDLERFHLDGGRKEAALEARLERLRRLRDAFPEHGDRKKIDDALAARVQADAALPWSATGVALRAQWLMNDGDRVAAHDLVQPCVTKYADTIGGRQCRHLLDTIEEPTLSVRGMAVDGLGKPSIAVDSHGLPRAYFRAFAYDAAGHLGLLAQTALPFRGLLLEDVVLEGLAAHHLAGAGDLEPLRGSAVGLHLGHSSSFLVIAPCVGRWSVCEAFRRRRRRRPEPRALLLPVRRPRPLRSSWRGPPGPACPVRAP